MSLISPAQTGKDLKRKLLLDAAYQVFTENGYHRTRLEDVAAQVGFSKASVYNYFQDKEALFLETSIMASTVISGTLLAELKTDRSALENIESMLRRLLADTGLFSFINAVSEFHGDAQMPDSPETEREHLIVKHREGLTGILKVLAEAVKAGKAQGELAIDLDETVTARLLTGLVRSVLLRWRLDGKKGDIDQEMSQIMTFAESGLIGRKTVNVTLAKKKISRKKSSRK